jgi:hypothetical protein
MKRIITLGKPFRFCRHRGEHVGQIVDFGLGVVAEHESPGA